MERSLPPFTTAQLHRKPMSPWVALFIVIHLWLWSQRGCLSCHKHPKPSVDGMRMESTIPSAQLSSTHSFSFAHKHIIKYFILLFTIDLFHYRAVHFISTSRNDITEAHLGISKRFFPLIEILPSRRLVLEKGGHQKMDQLEEASKRCSRQRNKRKMKQRDWVTTWEPAIVSPETSMMIAPTFHCRAKTLRGFWNVKTYFFFLYSTTLRQRTTPPHPHPPPWTLLTSLFPEAWKHNISQPATPTGTKTQRWKCKGYVLLDSCRQINLNMYFGHVCVPTASWGSWKWLCDINNIAAAWW